MFFIDPIKVTMIANPPKSFMKSYSIIANYFLFQLFKSSFTFLRHSVNSFVAALGSHPTFSANDLHKIKEKNDYSGSRLM
jgi:hypothetical protein